MPGDPSGGGRGRPASGSATGSLAGHEGLIAVAVVLVLLVGAGIAGTLLTTRGADPLPALAQPAAPPAPDDPAARVAWAASTATRTGVPARALLAYGLAESRARTEEPACGISWATLAGIGRVESDHGRFGGTALDGDGVPGRPIRGVALDGTRGNLAVRDTDDGRLDGDTRHDRAVGPLQFIPTTWALIGGDADADGRSDPQDADDAAVAAARYLCRTDPGDPDPDLRDLRRGDDWRAAVLTYNRSGAYVARVHAEASGAASRARAS